ncbi:MAG: ATP-binding protein [Leptospiraceae bacterium]|nr:ATP-binding protein [Leptospiraceae bacterium]
MHLDYYNQVLLDLEKKMIFLSGPRQVGKTTFAKSLQNNFKSSLYLNYDSLEDKKIIDKLSFSKDLEFIILDEIHKKRNWKNFLKGLFDTRPKNLRILVTGSARLETFRKGGDSLTGRYYSLRKLPLSLVELKQNSIEINLEELIEKGGFPEPFFSESKIERERWKNQYLETMIREEVLNFQTIGEIRSMEHLVNLLRKRVGSPISYRSLSEDLSISPNTVKKYIEILEALYVVFRITPYSKKIQRAIQREPKLYFFDWNLIEEEGARLENFFAVMALKHVYASNDFLGKRYELQFLRTKEGKEIDFAIIEKEKVVQCYEVKTTETDPDRTLVWFHTRFNLPIKQLVRYARHESMEKGIEIVPLEKELSTMYF